MAEYIDRDAFKKSVEARYCKPCKAEGKDHNGCWCRACWVDDMLDEVDAQPTIDAEPEVHGRWEMRGPSWYCTYCGVGYRVTIRSIPASRHNYCPNCGARMDGKAGD